MEVQVEAAQLSLGAGLHMPYRRDKYQRLPRLNPWLGGYTVKRKDEVRRGWKCTAFFVGEETQMKTVG